MPLAHLTASSEHIIAYKVDRGRLNTISDSCGNKGAWCSAKNDENPWIQADLGVGRVVSGVITQHSYRGFKWVESYKVNHSMDGITFEEIKTKDGDKVFPANSENKTEVTNIFPSVTTRFVRINPVNYTGRRACLRFEILKCQNSSLESPVCQPIGVKVGSIPLINLTASSEHVLYYGASRGRLNTKYNSYGNGAWCASNNDDDSWIKANFGVVKKVSGVITQKNDGGDRWVESYKVSHSINGVDFEEICETKDKFFSANNDNDSEVTRMFTPVRAQYIRINPVDWHNKLCLRFEVLGCRVSPCHEPLGVENDGIFTAQLTASSEFLNNRASNGRLNTKGCQFQSNIGAWCAVDGDVNPWIQADLGTVKEVTGIITQKASHANCWVESYKIKHSVNEDSFEAIKAENEDKIFSANSETNAEVTNNFSSVFAKFVRIYPVSHYNRVCLRFEILGCSVLGTTSEPEMISTAAGITADDRTWTDQSEVISTAAGVSTEEISNICTDQSHVISTAAGVSTDEISNIWTDQSEVISTAARVNTDVMSSALTDQSEMTFTISGTTTDELSSMSTDESGMTELSGSTTDEITNMLNDQTELTSTTSRKTTNEISSRPIYIEDLSSTLKLSTGVDLGNDLEEKQLFLWIRSQENNILQQLKHSNDSILSMEYSGLWIGNKTYIKQDFKLESNQTACASIQVSGNRSNLAIVFIYTDIGNLATGLANGVLFDDTMAQNGLIVHKTILVSGVMSVSIFGENANINVKVEYILPIVVQLNETSDYEEDPICVFYDIIAGKWSTTGCYLISFTQTAVHCFCSHLTSFAILMQISSNELPEQDEIINSWITTIGLSLSVVTLAINLIIYLILRAYKMSLRYKIHINFVLCTLSVNLVFLTSINNNGSKLCCKFVAVFLHYLVLCMFMWMLAEAVFLVIKVLSNDANRYKLRHYMMMCYLSPIFIVAIVAAISHECYPSETLCWLKQHCRFTVVIPGLLIIGVNITILGKMVHVIYIRSGPMLKKPPKIQKEYKQLRNAVRGSFVLFPILGVTWILGAFILDTTSIFFIYVYNILNSLQGVFVFIVFCLLDNEIKEAGKKWMIKCRPTQTRNKINVLPIDQHGQRHRSTLVSNNQKASSSTSVTYF